MKAFARVTLLTKTHTSSYTGTWNHEVQHTISDPDTKGRAFPAKFVEQNIHLGSVTGEMIPQTVMAVKNDSLPRLSCINKQKVMISRKTNSLCRYYCGDKAEKVQNISPVPFKTWQSQTLVQRRMNASQSSGTLQRIVFRSCRIAIEQIYHCFLRIWVYENVL